VHVIQVSHWYLFTLTLPRVQYVSSHYFEEKTTVSQKTWVYYSQTTFSKAPL